MMALLVTLAYGCAALGGAVALASVLVRVDRIDAAANGAWLARLVWLPGLVLLWSVVSVRWTMLERRREAPH